MRSVLIGNGFQVPDRDTTAPRIGLCRTPTWSDADQATQTLIESTAERFASAGASVDEVTFPSPFDRIQETHGRIMDFEAARNYAFEHRTRGADLSTDLREGVLARGLALAPDAYFEALKRAEAFRAFVDDQFGKFDAILAPSAPGEAPQGLGWTGDPRFNALWTLAWTPCVTLPAGRGPRGLPLGIQLVGARARDTALLDVAAWAELRLQ
jgi:amidase